jgi:hypothetical protein
MFKKFAFAALALATVVTSGYANAAPQSFVLANDTGRTITEARFSPPSSELPGPDLLPRILVDGDVSPIYFPSVLSLCVWDGTVVFRGGDQATARYNLCNTSVITVQ